MPDLPDLAIGKILGLLPTKLAVRASLVSKHWAHVWSLQVPALDFDDEFDAADNNNPRRDDHELRRRSALFANYLERCLEHYDRSQRDKDVSLDRFRLRAASFLIWNSSVDDWLSFAVKRKVKELDISLWNWWARDYCIQNHTLVNAAQYLTRLNLEHVVLGDIVNYYLATYNGVDRKRLFPFLEIMSLKSVVLEDTNSLYYMIAGCPCIRDLSLISCGFSSPNTGRTITVGGSSLKSLQIIDCKDVAVETYKTTNLESFTYVSESAYRVEYVILRECNSLKYVDISAPSLKLVALYGVCQHVEHMCIEAPDLQHATIVLNNDDKGASSISPWPFPRLRNLLASFDCSNHLDIRYRGDAQELVFPEELRKTLSPPLPNVMEVDVYTELYPQTEDIYSDLTCSVCWMAPSAEVIIHTAA